MTRQTVYLLQLSVISLIDRGDAVPLTVEGAVDLCRDGRAIDWIRDQRSAMFEGFQPFAKTIELADIRDTMKRYAGKHGSYVGSQPAEKYLVQSKGLCYLAALLADIADKEELTPFPKTCPPSCQN